MSTPPPQPPRAPHGGSRRLGAGMLVGAWVVLMLLALAFFQGWFDTARNPNSEPQSVRLDGGAARVVLAPNRAGHYLVSGTLDGTPADFLLDTGATAVAVPAGLASRAGLAPGAAIQLRTANGIAVGHRTRIDRLRFGDIELRQVAAIITPGLTGDEVLLGMSALGQLQWQRQGRDLVLTIPGR